MDKLQEVLNLCLNHGPLSVTRHRRSAWKPMEEKPMNRRDNDFDLVLHQTQRPTADQLRDGLIVRILSNILIDARTAPGPDNRGTVRREWLGTQYDTALWEVNETRQGRGWPALEPDTSFKIATLDALERSFEESQRHLAGLHH